MSYRKMKIVAATTLATLFCLTTPYIVTGTKPREIVTNINVATYKEFVNECSQKDRFAQGVYSPRHLYSVDYHSSLKEEKVSYYEYKTQKECKSVNDVFDFSDVEISELTFTKKDGKWVSKSSPLEKIAKEKIKEKLGVDME